MQVANFIANGAITFINGYSRRGSYLEPYPSTMTATGVSNHELSSVIAGAMLSNIRCPLWLILEARGRQPGYILPKPNIARVRSRLHELSICLQRRHPAFEVIELQPHCLHPFGLC